MDENSGTVKIYCVYCNVTFSIQIYFYVICTLYYIIYYYPFILHIILFYVILYFIAFSTYLNLIYY